MKQKNKYALYDSIMTKVAREVENALNEAWYEESVFNIHGRRDVGKMEEETEKMFQKLEAVKGEFYVIRSKDLYNNTDYSNEYDSHDTLGDAVAEYFDGLAEGCRYIVVDADGTILLEQTELWVGERYAMVGAYGDGYEIIKRYLTPEAKKLIRRRPR